MPKFSIDHPDDGKVVYSFRYRDQLGIRYRVTFRADFSKISGLIVRLFNYRGNRMITAFGFLEVSMSEIVSKKRRAGVVVGGGDDGGEEEEDDDGGSV